LVVDWESIVVQSTAIVVSVLIGSALSYLFAIQTARKERLYDSKVRKFEEFVVEIERVTNAIPIVRTIIRYKPGADQNPKETTFFLGGLSAVVLAPEKVEQIMNSLDAVDFGKSTGKRRLVKVAAYLRQTILLESSVALLRRMHRIDELASHLKVVQSSTVLSPAYSDVMTHIRELANSMREAAFFDFGISESVPDDSKVDALVEQIGASFDGLLNEIQREVRKTL
jgi:hypothetical protein